jgi:hypothetical protein
LNCPQDPNSENFELNILNFDLLCHPPFYSLPLVVSEVEPSREGKVGLLSLEGRGLRRG